MPEPPPTDGPVLVRTLAVGVCGTDFEIASGQYGWRAIGSGAATTSATSSSGRIKEAPEGSRVVRGELIVGVVRRPDPVPCLACATGEWDMCRNGKYTERGIKERHGYTSPSGSGSSPTSLVGTIRVSAASACC